MSKQPSSTTIPFSQEKLSFVEGFLSLFSKKYRLPARKWEFFHPRKAGEKLIEIPFVYLWHPWRREWVRDYCLNRPCMQLTVAIEAHEKTGKHLAMLKKEAIAYEVALINTFSTSLNDVVDVYRGNGTYDRTIAGESYSPGTAPKAKDMHRIKCTSSAEPYGGNNNKQKGQAN